jgi:hypothetical protein
VAIILWVSPIYILILLRGDYFDQNAKFLLILIYENNSENHLSENYLLAAINWFTSLTVIIDFNISIIN